MCFSKCQKLTVSRAKFPKHLRGERRLVRLSVDCDAANNRHMCFICVPLQVYTGLTYKLIIR
jgi:hypothetical protein